MEIARAKEILALIRAKESDGATYPSVDEEGWEAYAKEIGITAEELDEFVTLHLAGDLDPLLVGDDVPVSEGWPEGDAASGNRRGSGNALIDEFDFNDDGTLLEADGSALISSWDCC